MGAVDPPHRLSSKLSAVLCLEINHTNPLINLRPLLDNTNIPLRVIQTNTLREGGAPSGWKTDCFHVCMHPRKNTCRALAPQLSAPDPQLPAPNSTSGFSPDSFRQGARTEGWGNWRSGFPPRPNSATDLILHKKGFFLFGPAGL